MESTARLRQYLELRSKQLTLDLEAATLFVGKTETGGLLEDAVRRFLASSLPARYNVGLGEVISSKGPIARQTQAKDVIVYDAAYSPIFGWGEMGSHLYPVESVYAVIEVKKTLDTPELLRGVGQAIEAKKLSPTPAKPFTAVIGFEADTQTETLARKMNGLPPLDRVDFVLILRPVPGSGAKEQRATESDYIAHWFFNTPGVGGGPARFAKASEAASEQEQLLLDRERTRHIYLTWARSVHALMWFYLFLNEAMARMAPGEPDLWEYARAVETDLGYKGDC